jgi:acyl-CoA synthetase (AMP-forming)/AMP-acid ligase II
VNIALRISSISKKYPDKKSVVFSSRRNGAYDYPYYTFREFEERSNQMAHFFESIGIKEGMRTLLFVKPCLDFSVITFALFKIGAVPVLIDPGMGLKNLLSSVKQVRPHALIGMGKVHWLRRLKKTSFESVRINVSLERVGGKTFYLYEKLKNFPKEYAPVEREKSDPSAILFTSGGTGIPKGVVYTHGILNAQTDALQKMFSLDETQVDLPGFPLFALFTLAMGMTSVIPDLDPTRPASSDPRRLVQNILDNSVTFVAGSPAIWEKVGRFCIQKKINLGTIKEVVMFGAPVRGEIHQVFRKVLIGGDTYTPYGATECLPVSLISGKEILGNFLEQTKMGKGTCIGKAVPGVEIKIIKTTDIPEAELHELPAHEVGEIVVSGDQVTPSYFEMEEETNKAKIRVGEKLWHRMGDVGYLDGGGYLWFLGRKSHRVELSDGRVFYPIEIESIFNKHPEVRRTALIKVMKQGEIAPGLVIERHDGENFPRPGFMDEIRALGQTHEKTKVIKDFYLSTGFPVDVRHNIKIDRLKLSRWASEEGKSRCLKKVSS